MRQGNAYQKENIELFGRRRIYTDADEITEGNVIQVLQEALMWHEQNREQIAFLERYEKGFQPLKRKKTIRPEINIEVADNIANQVVEWKVGYHWGNPITFVQKEDNNSIKKDESTGDDGAIAMLNQMNDAEMSFSKDVQMGRVVEITGIGYQMVDIKRDYFDGESAFDLYTLDPNFSFIVYRNDIRETKVMGVTYRELENGDRYFTCMTKDKWYEIWNQAKIINGERQDVWDFGSRSGEVNPLGKVPIVEFIRSYDRLGVFERQIPDMDALNVEVSDFANACASSCQEIWWMNDAEFPVDPATGKRIKPVSGQWMQTKTAPNGNRPMIQALSSTFNYDGVQENIITKRNTILQKCYVPLQSDPGGGSTASAMSMSSGWSSAEAVAAAQENLTRASKMEIASLELIAIRKSPFIPADHPLKKLKLSDLQPKFTRQKTFDLGTKVNAMATLIKNGVHGRIAMETVDLFPDVAQAWEESKDLIEKYQTALFEEKQDTSADDNDRIMSDNTDQAVNSPLLDGARTGADYSQGGEK